VRPVAGWQHRHSLHHGAAQPAARLCQQLSVPGQQHGRVSWSGLHGIRLWLLLPLRRLTGEAAFTRRAAHGVPWCHRIATQQSCRTLGSTLCCPVAAGVRVWCAGWRIRPAEGAGCLGRCRLHFQGVQARQQHGVRVCGGCTSSWHGLAPAGRRAAPCSASCMHMLMLMLPPPPPPAGRACGRQRPPCPSLARSTPWAPAPAKPLR
jgi:hypothetical protein